LCKGNIKVAQSKKKCAVFALFSGNMTEKKALAEKSVKKKEK
jgi:hypothetical protein